jgi:hypothetical protein
MSKIKSPGARGAARGARVSLSSDDPVSITSNSGRKASRRVTEAERNAVGEIISQITDPKTGAPIATIKRLPGNLLAVDVVGDDALAHMQPFLPRTTTGVAMSATGKRKYRFVYRAPGGAS